MDAWRVSLNPSLRPLLHPVGKEANQRDARRTVRLGITAGCAQAKTESNDAAKFQQREQVAEQTGGVEFNANSPGRRERRKGFAFEIDGRCSLHESQVDGPSGDKVTGKGDPERSNGIQIFLQMSDAEEFPLRYSLSALWISRRPLGSYRTLRLETRVVTTSPPPG